MATGCAPQCAERIRPKRACSLALGVTLALALLGTTASAAQAKPRSNAEFTCAAITVHYRGFPDEPGNTIREMVRIDGVRRAVKRVFVFDGAEGVDTIPINLGPGHHTL